MAKTGELFVLTGIDGSGKATQTKLLVNRIKASGRNVMTLDFPRYEEAFFGHMVARYLRGEFGDTDQVNPYLASLMYAGDRWEAKDKLLKAAEAGVVMVCNRYVADNMAHQGGKIKNATLRQRFYGWIEELEHTVYGLPHPDLNILLDVPVEVAQRLINLKEQRAYLLGEKKDIHEADAMHLKSARQAFIELATLYFNWVKIECAPNNEILPPEEIAEKVWAEVKGFLG